MAIRWMPTDHWSVTTDQADQIFSLGELGPETRLHWVSRSIRFFSFFRAFMNCS